jgi:hypothetical protein
MSEEQQPDAPPPPRRGLWADALALLAVAALGTKAVIGGAELTDYDLGDETGFVVAASRIDEQGLPNAEFSPLYTLLARAHIAVGAPLGDVSYRMWATLAVAVPCCAFVLARALGAGRFAALAVAGFIPATALVDVWPYSPYLTACVIALGTALAARLPGPAGPAVLGLSLLTACYTRPENLYAFYGLAGLLAVPAVLGLCSRARRASTVRALALFATGAALLGWALGSPFHPGGRLIIAFGQHYTQNRATAEGWAGVGWVEDWTIRFRDDFGDAQSAGAAWRANPDAVYWHLWRNARRFPECLRACVTPHTELTGIRLPHVHPDAPIHRPKTRNFARWSVALVLALGLFGAARGVRHWWSGEDASALPLGALAALVLVPPMLAASLVVFPRFHYMLPFLVCGAALAAAGFRHLAPNAKPGAGATVALVAVLALVVPNRGHGWCAQQLLGGRGGQIIELPTTARDTVNAIRALNLQGTVKFLDHTASRQFYAGFGPDCANAMIVPPGIAFDEYVRANDVGVLILEPELITVGPVLRTAPEVRALAAGHESALFRLFPVEGHPHVRVAVRRDLLPKEVRP